MNPTGPMNAALVVVNRISDFKFAKENLEAARAAWLAGDLKYKTFLQVVQDTVEAERAFNKAMTDFVEISFEVA